MKRSAMRLDRQMNLPLRFVGDLPVISGDQQDELTRMLMELLINAARKTFDVASQGDADDALKTYA